MNGVIMINEKLTFIEGLILCAIAFIVGAVLAFAWADMPIVQFSWKSGECVQVIGAGSCDNLPKKYEHQWVY
jgi:TRAP-type mannitol/chloroaromatic compound transport system permease small subunit